MHPNHGCSPVTAFNVDQSVPIGFSYCVPPHQDFSLEERERTSTTWSAWSPRSGKYLSDPPVPMVEVHRVAEGVR